MPSYLIAPSLLSANFAKLGEEVDAVIAAGADMLHLDVMDNHYVPNLTVGPLVCEALRKYGITIPIDVHLMAKPVDQLIVDFAKAGATHITFHPEASYHVDRSLELIHQQGCLAGIALNPATSLANISYILDKIDIILIMAVNPGYGGQIFIPSALKKIRHVKDLITPIKHKIRLAVDGGVKVENIASIAEAGADMFITGSAIFTQPSYQEVISRMRNELAAINIDINIKDNS
jgi:ribulose-phosphate 3-epimerase